jgi:hypothetical protein
MLFAGFIGSAYWSNVNLPTPYSVPFGSSALSLISLVNGDDDSNTSSSLLLYSWVLCSMDTSLGYQYCHLFTPLQALMASREPGGDAFTVAPTG